MQYKRKAHAAYVRNYVSLQTEAGNAAHAESSPG